MAEVQPCGETDGELELNISREGKGRFNSKTSARLREGYKSEEKKLWKFAYWGVQFAQKCKEIERNELDFCQGFLNEPFPKFTN